MVSYVSKRCDDGAAGCASTINYTTSKKRRSLDQKKEVVGYWDLLEIGIYDYLSYMCKLKNIALNYDKTLEVPTVPFNADEGEGIEITALEESREVEIEGTRIKIKSKRDTSNAKNQKHQKLHPPLKKKKLDYLDIEYDDITIDEDRSCKESSSSFDSIRTESDPASESNTYLSQNDKECIIIHDEPSNIFKEKMFLNQHDGHDVQKEKVTAAPWENHDNNHDKTYCDVWGACILPKDIVNDILEANEPGCIGLSHFFSGKRQGGANGDGNYFGNAISFWILGTSPWDKSASPHVLSPPLMQSLQPYFPFSKSSDNFWLRYSLIRDGASIQTFLENAKGAKYTILAIETIHGEVFGAFTAEPWRKTWNCFGTGESFLWKLKHTRSGHPCSCGQIHLKSVDMERDVEVYTCMEGNADDNQMCHHDMIVVGSSQVPMQNGSSHDDKKKITLTTRKLPENVDQHEWGHGLCIQYNMRYGTTSPCTAFCSPSLSNQHANGSLFEIANLELWSLTPCTLEEDAEKLEMGVQLLLSSLLSADR